MMWRFGAVHSRGVLGHRESGGRDLLDVADIHDSHADFVWSSLQRLGIQAADLEDALQDVFVVVHRRLATFDGSSRLSTWLFGICLRVASQYRRKAHRHRERGVVDLDGIAGESSSAAPDAALLAREAEQRLERVLDALKPERRVVFVMFEIEGIGCAEIAEQLGLPLGTVFSRLSAARTDFSKAALRLRRHDEQRRTP
jgi:RNA polymerase sigma-70 factor (ECF subfamily)